MTSTKINNVSSLRRNEETLLTIIDETPDLLIINKPPFLLVHPTKPGGPLTLWDKLKELLAYEITTDGQVSLINRIDRETSGIVLVAKNHAAARTCAMAMERGAIAKEYLALVYGWIQEDNGTIDAPLLRLGDVVASNGVLPKLAYADEVQDAHRAQNLSVQTSSMVRAPEQRSNSLAEVAFRKNSKIWLKRGIHPNGAPALTHFQVEQRLLHPKHGAITLVRCFPRTGRTHQIRVHLASLGHPIIGDKIYGPSEDYYLEFIQTGWTPFLAEKLWLPRHALHANVLELVYQEKQYRWESPPPSDLLEFIKEC
ncbi:MAG: hypothetical protein A3F67_07305 [Verrucomicrobia bacterium RIFCSPHIGHO2_12_FULL_41_10]|nr:MAG: hypothetical protein A3F67_07305 [Verrucomicrobia bacterium RIFCSPHIGHO2_12_FULL_41_10]HLB33459.1 RluA family pseudouridine synthase [Chthoniobacterales bacterium]